MKESAFPVHGGYPNDDPRNQIIGGGLTKREYFAGLAMQGICASQAGDKYHVNDGWLHPETVAKAAIEMADELLKQLSQ